MLRLHSHSLHSLLVLLDVALSGSIFWLIMDTTGAPLALSPSLLTVATVAMVAWPLTLQQLGLYESQRRTALDSVVGRLLLAGCVATVGLTAAAFAVDGPLPAEFPVVFGLCQFAVLASERLLIHTGLRLLRRFGRNSRHVLIVGTGPRALDVRNTIGRHPEWGLKVVGHADDQDVPISPAIPTEQVFKLIDMPRILDSQVIDEVIIACPRSMLGSLVPVVGACGSAGVPFTLLADIFGDYLPPPAITRFDSLAALRFASVHHSPTGLAVKRSMDIVGATLGLLIAAPVVAAAAVAIKLTSSGPVFFKQLRSGLYGRRFEMYKLRTMDVDAESQLENLLPFNQMDGPVFKVDDDPRITGVGRWLRRFSLDELPQLWNVLRGDMSLVGPRPPLPHEVAQYETFERRRLSMRPGITCYWQVGGRNQIGFDEWVRLDLEYIDTWSVGTDLKILLRTLPAVAGGVGAS